MSEARTFLTNLGADNIKRHGVTSFCRRVNHKKTAVLKSVVSKPPFGVRFRLGRVNRTAAHPTFFICRFRWRLGNL